VRGGAWHANNFQIGWKNINIDTPKYFNDFNELYYDTLKEIKVQSYYSQKF
jgi:hypothetical protein